jgi:hypothetical protein
LPEQNPTIVLLPATGERVLIGAGILILALVIVTRRNARRVL